MDVGFDVDGMFHRVTAGLETDAAMGGSELGGWIKSQRHAFHTMNTHQ